MKNVYAGIASRSVRAREEDARDHPPSREDVQKAQQAMREVGTRYQDAFRQYNVVAIAYPPTPFPAPLLPAEGDDVPSGFELNGQPFAIAVIRNAVIGPVYRAPGLSIPAELTSDGLPVGLEIDGLPGQDSQFCCASAWPSKPCSDHCRRRHTETVEAKRPHVGWGHSVTQNHVGDHDSFSGKQP